MKQKMVIKVKMHDEKSRTKAMKTVVGVSGVESAAVQGSERDQLEVIGEGVDSVVLARLLRKHVGYADLISVGPLPEKKPDPPKPAAAQAPPPGQVPLWVYPTSYPPGSYHQPMVYEVRDSEPNCSIM